MVLMIVVQPTNALVHASSMTNTTDYPHLYALCREYLQFVVASLDLIVLHRAGHNGRHACVLDMALRLTFDLTVPVGVVRSPIIAEVVRPSFERALLAKMLQGKCNRNRSLY